MHILTCVNWNHPEITMYDIVGLNKNRVCLHKKIWFSFWFLNLNWLVRKKDLTLNPKTCGLIWLLRMQGANHQSASKWKLWSLGFIWYCGYLLGFWSCCLDLWRSPNWPMARISNCTVPDVSIKEASKKWLRKWVSNGHIFKPMTFLTSFHNTKLLGTINPKVWHYAKIKKKS